MTSVPPAYPVRFSVDYPERLDRLSTVLRVFYILPVLVVYALVSGGSFAAGNGNSLGRAGGGTAGAIGVALVLMLLFRRKYPRWWFDWLLALNRFGARVGAYAGLLTDRYPSTDEDQSVHLDLDYPDATQLHRWLPLVKWFLAIPHYIVLHPVHGTLSRRPFRFRGRRSTMVASRFRLCIPNADRPVPAVQPRIGPAGLRASAPRVLS